MRQIEALRRHNSNFSVPQLVLASGFAGKASMRTFYREMHRHGMGFRRVKPKGVLTHQDKKLRLAFAKAMLKKPAGFWCREVCFYMDGVGFSHCYNPLHTAAAPRGRVWMRQDEGLLLTGKGRREGTTGNVLKFMVALSYGKGIVVCEPYERLCGAWYAAFVRRCFPQAFLLSQKTQSRVFVQDNDASQQSSPAIRALAAVRAQQLFIPARSPDFNPIENRC